MFNAFPYCKRGHFASTRHYLTMKQHFVNLEFEDIFHSFLFVMAPTKFGGKILKIHVIKTSWWIESFLSSQHLLKVHLEDIMKDNLCNQSSFGKKKIVT